MAETSVTYNTLSNVSSGMDGGPFSLDNTSIYNEWRRKKLSLYPVSLENLLVKIDNICRITPKEESLILERCQKYNMAVYQVGAGQCDINQLKSFCRVFGDFLHSCRSILAGTASSLLGKSSITFFSSISA